jgi:flagellar assembly protein FliH
MQDKVKAIIDNANATAQKHFVEMESQIKALLEKAKERGLQKGYQSAQELSLRLRNLHLDMQKEMRGEILSGAVSIARAAIDAEIKMFEETILPITLKVLSTIPDAKHISLRVNPEDAEYLKNNKERIINALERAKDVEIRNDKHVARGGLLIQTEYGLIDAQLATQLEELARAMGNENGANH